MNKTLLKNESQIAGGTPARGVSVRGWQRWAPYAALAWSYIYAALGIYWAVGGGGFPYTSETMSSPMGPLIGRLGLGAAWITVMAAGLPAVALGTAMLRGVRGRVLRPFFITTGTLLAGVLLLLMTGLDLLVMLGYVPYTIVGLFTGAGFNQPYLKGLTQWTTLHQGLCLLGGFLWLAATVSYARRSGDACLVCGRRSDSQGWNSPQNAARWGRIAVVVSLVAPVFYALSRYAWALGLPLGMTEAAFRSGQERGLWISGLFLASFGLVGALLTLGLVQRWGEVFPRWMIGLAGRRVPIALAIVPAALVSVVVIVGGIGIWSSLGQMSAALASTGVAGFELVWEIIIQLGGTLLFPLWGVALAVAALGYYYRRRGPSSVCGRG